MHIHDYKEYKEQVFYTGSFTRYSFDTQEDKGYIVVSVNNENHEDYEVLFYENEDAPTYGIINIDDMEFKDGEDKLEIIKKMKDSFDFVKIKTDDKANLDILKKLSENDNNIKVQTTNRSKEISKVDKKYAFILERKLSIEETIAKFISIKNGKSIPVNKIRAIISENDISLDDIKVMTDSKDVKNVRKITAKN